jgi:hypothetical protein
MSFNNLFSSFDSKDEKPFKSKRFDLENKKSNNIGALNRTIDGSDINFMSIDRLFQNYSTGIYILLLFK